MQCRKCVFTGCSWRSRMFTLSENEHALNLYISYFTWGLKKYR
jgi:hypothetical protein